MAQCLLKLFSSLKPSVLYGCEPFVIIHLATSILCARGDFACAGINKLDAFCTLVSFCSCYVIENDRYIELL